MRGSLLLIMVVGLLSGRQGFADPAAFDLAGPSIEVEITRGERTLPVSQVPNLATGDRVRIKADLPPGQSAHYLMVATFLQGATNPPPKEWFHRCETWTSRCLKEGLILTVPVDAQQLIIFLAPETGGDFSTLTNAVRGRPGAFARTSQDLVQASLDRSRLDTYLSSVRALGDSDPSRLKAAAPLLARSLAIKVDEKCLGKIPVLQAPCLAQGRESLILDDGHSASIAQQLTSGPASDLAMEASNTPQLRSGYYGPFIGSMFDIAKIFGSFHTAQYQYFPALASARGNRLALTLNAPPSFHDPKSVLVVALPAVEGPQLPPLHVVEPEETLCARREQLVLAVEGAPLVFSTEYAHDWTLHLETKNGSALELPARADPSRGGFVVETHGLGLAVLNDLTSASLRAKWGFDDFNGPTFRFADPGAQTWKLGAGDDTGLIIGRPDTIHLQASSVSCLESLILVSPSKQWTIEWKKTGPKEVEATLPLQEAQPGEMTLMVKQFGSENPQRLSLRAFSEAGHLERFAVHAGDSEGVLSGHRLDEVDNLTFQNARFSPGNLSTHEGQDQLALVAEAGRSIHLPRSGEDSKALVTLKDGRTVQVRALVDSPRPSAVLISKTMQHARAAGPGDIQLLDEQELPLQGELTFSLRARSPGLFTHEDRLEVATADDESSVMLDIASGTMVLQSAKVAVATLDPQKSLGVSAFGPLRFRRIINGVPGDWRPLVTLVRLPKLTELDCPEASDAACTLTGVNLFLLDSISNDAQFTQPTNIPEGFTDQSIAIPHPQDGHLFVRLRDDPAVVNTVVLEVKTPSNPAEAAAEGRADGAGAAEAIDGSGQPPPVVTGAAAVMKGAAGSDHGSSEIPTPQSPASSKPEEH